MYKNLSKIDYKRIFTTLLLLYNIQLQPPSIHRKIYYSSFYDFSFYDRIENNSTALLDMCVC